MSCTRIVVSVTESHSVFALCSLLPRKVEEEVHRRKYIDEKKMEVKKIIARKSASTNFLPIQSGWLKRVHQEKKTAVVVVNTVIIKTLGVRVNRIDQVTKDI